MAVVKKRFVIPKLGKLNENDILVDGPIVHEKLSPELDERVRKFESVFAELLPTKSHQDWLEGFQRDLDPEFEVGIWEAIASAYQRLLDKHSLLLPAKKEAFGRLIGLVVREFMGSPCPVALVIGRAAEATQPWFGLRHLRSEQAKELYRLFSTELNKQQRPFSPTQAVWSRFLAGVPPERRLEILESRQSPYSN